MVYSPARVFTRLLWDLIYPRPPTPTRHCSACHPVLKNPGETSTPFVGGGGVGGWWTKAHISSTDFISNIPCIEQGGYWQENIYTFESNLGKILSKNSWAMNKYVRTGKESVSRDFKPSYFLIFLN